MEENYLAKNNPTDLNSYDAFMLRQKELFHKIKNETENQRKEKNLIDWENSLEWPWNKADISFFKGLPVSLMNEVAGTKRLLSFVISAAGGRGKTFLTYSIIKEFIKNGAVTPSEIRWTSVSEAAQHVNGNFDSRNWKKKFFDKSAKLFVVEGASKTFTAMGVKDYERFIDEFTQLINENGKHFIITYSQDEGELKDIKDRIPSLSTTPGKTYELLKKAKFIKVDKTTRNENKKLTRDEDY